MVVYNNPFGSIKALKKKYIIAIGKYLLIVIPPSIMSILQPEIIARFF